MTEQETLDSIAEACAKVIERFDKSIFVRDTSKDADPTSLIQLYPYLRALSQLNAFAVARGKGA